MTNIEKETSYNGDANQRTHVSLFRDTSIIIGIITLMGYMLAYNYQKGFRGYYSIDDIFLNDITLTQIVISIASILSVATVIFNFYPFISKIIFLDKQNYKLLVTRFIVQYWIIAPVLILVLMWIYLKASVAMIIYTGCIYYLLTALPILIESFFNEGNNFIVKFRNSILKPSPSFLEVAKFNILESKKGFLVGLFASFVLLGVFSNLIGYSQAAKKDEYYTFEYQNADYIVVGNYRDNLIIAPFDKINNLIIPSYQIIESKSTLEKPLILTVTQLKTSPDVMYSSSTK